MNCLIECRELTRTFELKEGMFRGSRTIRAVDRVSLSIGSDETVGLVGESGSGKSTLGRMLLRLIEPDSGSIFFSGTDITKLPNKALKPVRRKMQAIFQDPFSSLNPKFRIGTTLREPLEIHPLVPDGQINDEIRKVLIQVGLEPSDMDKYPHEFSGGQRQRINIARSLILKPEFIIADEPVSSLDVSIQAQIINLFMELKKEYGFSMLFISHDLRIVRHISDRIAVISKGRIVEIGTVHEIFEQTAHPYTRMLINSLPEKKAARLAGSKPELSSAITDTGAMKQLSETHYVLSSE